SGEQAVLDAGSGAGADPAVLGGGGVAGDSDTVFPGLSTQRSKTCRSGGNGGHAADTCATSFHGRSPSTDDLPLVRIPPASPRSGSAQPYWVVNPLRPKCAVVSRPNFERRPPNSYPPRLTRPAIPGTRGAGRTISRTVSGRMTRTPSSSPPRARIS